MNDRSIGRHPLLLDGAGFCRLVGRLIARAALGVSLIGVGGASAGAGPASLTRLQLDLAADLYQLRCSGCHGLNGEGLIGPSLVDSVLPIAAVVEQIANGAGSMPAFSGVLSPGEIDAVAVHVVGFRPASPTTTTGPTSTSTTTTSTTTTTSPTTTAPTTTSTTTTTAPTTTTTAPTTTSTSAASATSSSTSAITEQPATQAPEAADPVDTVGGPPVVPMVVAGVMLAGGLWFVLYRRRLG